MHRVASVIRQRRIRSRDEWPLLWRCLHLAAIGALWLAVIMILSGCQQARDDTVQQALDANTLASSEQARAGAHIEVVRMGLGQLGPYVIEQGQSLLSAIGDYAAKASESNAALSLSIAQERRAIHAVGDALEKSEERYTAIEARWYVRWGRRVERALWTIGIIWLLLGIASVIFGLGNPLSWSWRIGKEIARLLPFANPFRWVLDWLVSRRQTQNADGMETE